MSTPQSLSERVRPGNEADIHENNDFVLLWMTAFRRPNYNHSLDCAVAHSRKLNKPLLIVETLPCDYAWATLRRHRFVLQGMADNKAAFAAADIAYYPFVERKAGEHSKFIKALSQHACVVVADDFPAHYHPQMYRDIGPTLGCALQLVDSNGLLPIRAVDRIFPTAYAFRRTLQKVLPDYLDAMPRKTTAKAAHLKGAAVPSKLAEQFPAADDVWLAADSKKLETLPIDCAVGPAKIDGGHKAAKRCLTHFLANNLPRYIDDRNHPDKEGQSGLSPYLHHGQISAYEIFTCLAEQEDWNRGHLSQRTSGGKEGFWGMSAAAESFIDEFVTWREVGDNMCVQRPDDYDKYESLPDWAKKTLAEHADDPRETTYSHAQLEKAQTDDAVWNAAQNEIVRTGSMNNYMRMLWGKRVLTWTKRPQEALPILIDLNNKYGIDGCDSNSYSGILWVFGRYDRPWPEHAIFGKVRMMTSASTKRKLQLKNYLEEFSS